MKPHTLPVKRRPAPKGLLRRLSAVTTRRKQHVAATADADMDLDDGSSKISRALTIIFLIHIVAIGLIFVHQKFLDGRAPEEQKTATTTAKETPAVATPAPRRQDVPRLSSGEKPYIVRAGDNYTRIAAAEGVDEGDLKRVNQHVDIGPGLILKIPPKRPATEDPQMAASIGDAVVPVPTGSNELVDAVDVSNAPRATLVRGKVSEQAKTAAPSAAKPSASSGKSHVIQNGESIWKIANRYKVSQAELMKINGISDPRKVKAGMNLTIP